MNTPLHIYVFVDALGWEQVTRYHVLEDTLPNRRALEMQFGYSCTAIPTILTGKRPNEHGHLTFYNYSPATSPFKMMRWLAPFLKPDSFWKRGRIRNQLSKLIKKLYGYTGYFQLYGVPIERLPFLDYCEKQDLFVPGAFGPIANLADTWQAQGHRWLISDWRKPEADNFAQAVLAITSQSIDRAFVYSAAFDALEHDHPGDAVALQLKVDSYCEQIQAIATALQACGRPYSLTVISDHGMTPLRGTIDLVALLKPLNLVWGKDYALCLDSTMARFWWLTPDAQETIQATIDHAQLQGRWVTDEQAIGYGINRDDHLFGDAIFLADPGVQFVPSDMGIKPLNGMHGFDPKDKDSLAAILSTRPLPDHLKGVWDLFHFMTQEDASCH